jgi:hypothetical protein
LGLLEVKLLPWELVQVLLNQQVLILSTAAECLFSVSDTSETINYMETATPNMALVYVPTTSVTKF